MRIAVWPVEARFFRCCGLISVSFVLATTAPALAQDRDPDAELKQLEETQAATRTRLKSLSDDAARFASENEALSRQLAAAADAVRLAERQIDTAEDTVAELDRDIRRKTIDLTARREALASTLSALLGVARMPPLAAVAQPGQIAENAMTASALAGVTPVLQGRVARLRSDLMELDDLRKRKLAARRSANETIATLAAERDKLELLLRDRREQLDALSIARDIESTRLARLAARARDLNSLMDQLAPVTTLARIPDRPARRTSVTSLKGQLPMPAEGRISHRFGDHRPGAPHEAQGLTLSTRSSALVTAPHDGTVSFAGPFRSYGRLLIIDLGDGYHLLIAGLAQSDVTVGQWVLAGEPVGSMTRTTDGKRPELYLELRRNGSPVDPLPWMAPSKGKSSG
ncbi:MAG: peptidoglycan DD-metalloendopeptidase family protein [Minwuia sp.]|nr:peptidoglycan DD-metalloendopeptidase family protein [Minwuia sp.]